MSLFIFLQKRIYGFMVLCMSLNLSKFDDLKKTINDLYDKVEFYENSNIACFIKLKEPTTFNIFGKEEVECKYMKFYETGELKSIRISGNDTYKGYYYNVSFFKDGSISFGFVDSMFTNFYGADNDLKNVDIEGCASITYNKDNKDRYIENITEEGGKITLYGKEYSCIDFDKDGVIIGYRVKGGSIYVDLIQEREFQKRVEEDLPNGSKILKTISKILKENFTNDCIKEETYDVKNIVKVIND